jgi:hypothetical protein
MKENKKYIFEVDFSNIFPIFHTFRLIYDIKNFLKFCHFLICYKNTPVKGFEGRCINCAIKDTYCGKLDIVRCPNRFDRHYELRYLFKWIKKLS